MSPFFVKDRILSHTVQRWLFLSLTIATAISTAFLLVQGAQVRSDVNGLIRNAATEQAKTVARAKKEACVENRTLLTAIILRSVGASYEQFKANPEMVLNIYRKQLLGNPQFRNDPLLVDDAVERTRDILNQADPEKCP